MRVHNDARVSTYTILFRFIAVCLAATLLLSGGFAVLPARTALAAGSCTSVADGSWSAASTWSCGHAPTSADDVVIADDNEVTIGANQSANNLTINFYGILTVLSPVTLTLYGDFDVQGIFDDHEGGTVLLAGTNQTILTHGYWVDFSNLTKIAAGPDQSLAIDPAVGSEGGIHVLNDLILQGTAPDYLLLRSTSAGSPWQINAAGFYDLRWLDVQDSRNTSEFVIDVVNGVDSGNNSAWAFVTSPESIVALTSSANPSFRNQPVTFTATIAPSSATGTVTFLNDDDNIAGCESEPVVAGVATCTTSALDHGSHNITAVYSGDGTHNPGTSSVLVQNVVEVLSTLFLPVIGR